MWHSIGNTGVSLRIVVHLLAAALSAALSLAALGGLPSLLPLETAAQLPAWFIGACCGVAAANSYIIACKIFEFIQSAKNGE